MQPHWFHVDSTDRIWNQNELEFSSSSLSFFSPSPFFHCPTPHPPTPPPHPPMFLAVGASFFVWVDADTSPVLVQGCWWETKPFFHSSSWCHHATFQQTCLTWTLPPFVSCVLFLSCSSRHRANLSCWKGPLEVIPLEQHHLPQSLMVVAVCQTCASDGRQQQPKTSSKHGTQWWQCHASQRHGVSETNECSSTKGKTPWHHQCNSKRSTFTWSNKRNGCQVKNKSCRRLGQRKWTLMQSKRRSGNLLLKKEGLFQVLHSRRWTLVLQKSKNGCLLPRKKELYLLLLWKRWTLLRQKRRRSGKPLPKKRRPCQRLHQGRLTSLRWKRRSGNLLLRKKELCQLWHWKVDIAAVKKKKWEPSPADEAKALPAVALKKVDIAAVETKKWEPPPADEGTASPVVALTCVDIGSVEKKKWEPPSVGD